MIPSAYISELSFSFLVPAVGNQQQNHPSKNRADDDDGEVGQSGVLLLTGGQELGCEAVHSYTHITTTLINAGILRVVVIGIAATFSLSVSFIVVGVVIGGTVALFAFVHDESILTVLSFESASIKRHVSTDDRTTLPYL